MQTPRPPDAPDDADARGADPHGFDRPARLSYTSYLKVPQLLELQHLLSSPPHRDELQFIIVHQAYELWFKLMLNELEHARATMLAGSLDDAVEHLERCHAIERIMIEHFPVIETMAPAAFLAFRDHLRPASGFQSVQFREIEILSGLRDKSYLEFLRTEDVPEVHAAMDRRLAEPSLRDAMHAMLQANGFAINGDAQLDDSILRVCTDREPRAIYRVLEALIEHDQGIRHWRHRHVLMVERIIGSKPGTGGSSGAQYLRATTTRLFYPELWRVRGALGAEGYGGR